AGEVDARGAAKARLARRHLDRQVGDDADQQGVSGVDLDELADRGAAAMQPAVTQKADARARAADRVHAADRSGVLSRRRGRLEWIDVCHGCLESPHWTPGS